MAKCEKVLCLAVIKKYFWLGAWGLEQFISSIREGLKKQIKKALHSFTLLHSKLPP